MIFNKINMIVRWEVDAKTNNIKLFGVSYRNVNMLLVKCQALALEAKHDQRNTIQY